MKGLKFFSRTSGKGCWNLASFHSPHSMTWSWILSFSLPRSRDEGRWLYFSHYRSNVGLEWSLQVARTCLRWHRQRPMWYRDCYMRLRDKQDGLLPPEDRPLPHSPHSPPSLTVMDGGQSLH